MAVQRSAGILVYRHPPQPEVLLGHMGGPFWRRKDNGAWTIPKGEYGDSETPEDAARREFTEELGIPLPPGDLQPLGEIRQSGGKVVTAWALHADVDLSAFSPGTFEIEWPPRSGRRQSFPELDRVAWFDVGTARSKVVKAQAVLLDRLVELLQ